MKSPNFDPRRAEAAKRDAMSRAERSANPAWQLFMATALVDIARRKPFLTTDDLERARQNRTTPPTTHENRSLGPLMKWGEKLNVIEPTDRWWRSDQRSNHRRWQRVWYSLIFEGRPVAKPKRARPIDPRQYGLL